MIHIPFNSQVQPPAPFVLVELTNPLNGALLADVPAQLDTAADRTLVPTRFLTALGMEPVDSIDIGGMGGAVAKLSVYLVLLAIKSLPARRVSVVTHANEPWVLLGRDVLNHHRIILDGPRLALEIS